MPLPAKGVTELLFDLKEGRTEADPELMALIYRQLRRIAATHFRRERADHTMQPTDLVHAAYVRLMEPGEVPWKDRIHFFSIASEVMRRVLIDEARKRKAGKRGGGQPKLELDETIAFEPTQSTDLLVFDEALKRLAKFDRKESRIVELRVFGGLTVEETAEVLGIRPGTVKSHWAAAKAWLRRELGNSA